MQNETARFRAVSAVILHSKLFILHSNAGSSNRRTAPFEGANAGAIPAPAASFGKSSFDPPDGEIESRLAYTQKSRGQNLLGRPTFAKATAWRAIASLHNQECAGL